MSTPMIDPVEPTVADLRARIRRAYRWQWTLLGVLSTLAVSVGVLFGSFTVALVGVLVAVAAPLWFTRRLSATFRALDTGSYAQPTTVEDLAWVTEYYLYALDALETAGDTGAGVKSRVRRAVGSGAMNRRVYPLVSTVPALAWSHHLATRNHAYILEGLKFASIDLKHLYGYPEGLDAAVVQVVNLMTLWSLDIRAAQNRADMQQRAANEAWVLLSV